MRLRDVLDKPTRRILGINSGTSMDGVDLAYIEAGARVRILKWGHRLFPQGLKEHIHKAVTSGRASEWGQLETLLGQIFSDAAVDFIKHERIADLDAIGLHGQTIFHHPHQEVLFHHQVHSSLQVGDPDIVAKRSGILTVSHFRNGDVAVGGGGAPLVPILDLELFRDPERTRVLLNIGGIANVTILHPESTPVNLLAFDTGPGNALIDYYAMKLFGQPFDAEGRTAASGRVHRDLLRHLMKHEYFHDPPPKSTGTEVFGESLAGLIARQTAALTHEDVLATMTEWTAQSIADQLKTYGGRPAQEVIVSGGGARNAFLMSRLEKLLAPASVRTTDEVGVPSDAKEAVLFAYLAHLLLDQQAGNIPAATGARRPALLGRISFP